jgi:aspartate carbamoyltransferase regulatory subunit
MGLEVVVEKETLKVSKLRNGTVIDHIPAKRGLRVLAILGLLENIPESAILIGLNLKSKKLGKKDIIKIEDKALDLDEINKISILAPNATISLIENFEITRKIKSSLTDVIVGILICSNPRCITKSENIKTVFYVENKEPIRVRCKYCERIMNGKDVFAQIEHTIS